MRNQLVSVYAELRHSRVRLRKVGSSAEISMGARSVAGCSSTATHRNSVISDNGRGRSGENPQRQLLGPAIIDTDLLRDLANRCLPWCFADLDLAGGQLEVLGTALSHCSSREFWTKQNAAVMKVIGMPPRYSLLAAVGPASVGRCAQ